MLFSAITVTIFSVIGDCKISPPSDLIYSMLFLATSLSMTNCSAFSCRGSNNVCLAVFCACNAFSSNCKALSLVAVLIFFGRDTIFYPCFTSAIVASSLFSFSCSSWRLPSSAGESTAAHSSLIVQWLSVFFGRCPPQLLLPPILAAF